MSRQLEMVRIGFFLGFLLTLTCPLAYLAVDAGLNCRVLTLVFDLYIRVNY